MMDNPIAKMWCDSGVYFIKFLWEECQFELENMTQDDINEISKVVIKIGKKTRPEYFADVKINGK